MPMLEYFVWLSSLEGLSKKSMYRLLMKFGNPKDVYEADENKLRQLGGANDAECKILGKKSLAEAQRIISKCDELGISIITYSDKYYCERLKSIHIPPILYYQKGIAIDLDDEIAVTFVGPRNASPAAKGIITEIAEEFAASGGMVVSGMALGIDGASHRGAMLAGMPTVGVLGCGIDVCYPKENRAIYDYLLKNGVIISEYPPGARPLGCHFPERNRIMSGLSLGTVIIEAPERSGSLITANFALSEGRDVFVVPGNLGPASVGSNTLLRDGAKPVLSAVDIIEEYVPLYPHKIISEKRHYAGHKSYYGQGQEGNAYGSYRAAPPAAKPAAPVRKEIPEGLNEMETKIVVVVNEGKVHIDKIIERTGASAKDVLSAITTLEIKGIIEELPGKFFDRK